MTRSKAAGDLDQDVYTRYTGDGEKFPVTTTGLVVVWVTAMNIGDREKVPVTTTGLVVVWVTVL